MNQTSERQQAVIDALVDAGVDRKDISTTQVSLQPQYGNPDASGSANITGYRAATPSGSRSSAIPPPRCSR